MKFARLFICLLLLPAGFACRSVKNQGSIQSPEVISFVTFQTNRIVAQNNVQLRRRLDWHLATLVKDYKRLGQRNPKWDRFALEALTLHAYRSVLPEDRFAAFAERIATACRAATQAGCDD